MRRLGSFALSAVLSVAAIGIALAPTTALADVVVEEKELEASWLQLTYETATIRPDGTETASSSGRQALVETVVEETSEGTILLYDWPRDEEGEARSNFWYFPARILEKPDGSLDLLDKDVVEERIEHWLQKYSLPREACGYWSHGGGFPFRVDCDPNIIFQQIEGFYLRGRNLSQGAEFTHGMASKLGILEPLAAPRSGLQVTVQVDEEKSREAEAKQALITAQMFGDALTREEAEEQAQKTRYSGDIMIEFDIDNDGTVVRRTETSRITIERPDKPAETTKAIMMVERLDLEAAFAKYRR